MGDRSAIEWTDATWNPIVGCSIVSPGCTNCYAMRMAARIEAMDASPARAAHRFRVGEPQTHYAGTTKKVNGHPVWTGHVAQAPDHILTAPLRWKKPRCVFVNSMGDLFHESIPDEWIDKIFAVMALAPRHTFQVLTKRAARMREYLTAVHPVTRWAQCAPPRSANPLVRWSNPLPNVWLGISAERQQEADERIPLLLHTPAAVRFVSLEPLLGPIKLHERLGDDWLASGLSGERRGLDWIIVGGESGPHARPMHPQWARDIRDQCAAAGVAYFFKQFGEWRPAELHDLASEQLESLELQNRIKAIGHHGCQYMIRVGKKAAGRVLDGRTHDDLPQVGTSNMTESILWCCHVRGPDDVYAAPDYPTALQWADTLNALNWRGTPHPPPLSYDECLIKAAPAPWPWSAEDHAKALPQSIAEFER